MLGTLCALLSVVNLSIGKAVEESNATDPLVLAVEQVWDSGITVVVAAGNFGRDGNMTITSPGNARKVITVGSVTTWGDSDPGNDIISTFSSRGPTLGDHIVKPDLVTPGNRLISINADRSYLESNHPERLIKAPGAKSAEYYQLSGTSMAAGVVTGATRVDPPTPGGAGRFGQGLAVKDGVLAEVRQQMFQQFGGAGAQNMDLRSLLPDDMFTANAEKRVKLGLLLSELISKFELQADADRVRQTIEEMAATYQDPEEVVNWYYSNQEQLSAVQSRVLEDQVVEKLLESANIIDKECSYQDALAEAQAQAER